MFCNQRPIVSLFLWLDRPRYRETSISFARSFCCTVGVQDRKNDRGRVFNPELIVQKEANFGLLPPSLFLNGSHFHFFITMAPRDHRHSWWSTIPDFEISYSTDLCTRDQQFIYRNPIVWTKMVWRSFQQGSFRSGVTTIPG